MSSASRHAWHKSSRKHLRRRSRVPGVLRLGRPSETWFKPALSVVASVAPPNLTLLALGRLDLAAYTMAGSLCALYAHNRPYRTRAMTLVRVILGMVGGLAVSLTAASLVSSGVLLVTIGAVLAALHKVLVDATRLGPPGNVIFTFISSACLFLPQTLGQVPGHVGLAILGGAWAWLVGMAPALLRPDGPERRATAQALNAVAAYAQAVRDGDSGTGPRASAAASLQSAWQTLMAVGPDSPSRRTLERLLVRAEAAFAAPVDADSHTSDPSRLRDQARSLSGRKPLPHTAAGPAGTVDELLGVDVELHTPQPPLWQRIVALRPIALRTLLGCALAGYVCLALGVGRPYWALVTAASLYQANLTLTWRRSVQRVVGNLIGVGLFAVLAPVMHISLLALVLVGVVMNFGAEALITRNYWLGTVCVTTMALVIVEFPGYQDTIQLVADRALDTVVGGVVGLAAALLVTNRTAGDRVSHALDAVERASRRAKGTLDDPAATPAALLAARHALAAELAVLRSTADAAAGEWWQRALPQEEVVTAEQEAHRTLAETVRRQRQSFPAPATALVGACGSA